MLDMLILQKNIHKKIKKLIKKIAGKLDYNGIECPEQEKDFNKIEIKNNICIIIYVL